MIKSLFLLLIKSYQYFVSPLLGPRCRFYPSCSEYWVLAIQKWGLVSGGCRGVRRLLKCQPLHPGGVDIP